MRYATTALRCWLTAAALLLALCCPLPVFAARAGAVLPVTVRTEGTATDAACVVSITPLDAAPAPAQASLTIQGSGTAYFTGFAFDAPGDYRYTVTQSAAYDLRHRRLHCDGARDGPSRRRTEYGIVGGAQRRNRQGG